jgi:hypothetical protein
MAESEPSVNSRYLAAHIAYLKGDYDRAEELIRPLAKGPLNEMGMKSRVGLLMTYYQQKTYDRAASVFKDVKGKIDFALLDLMKSFGNEKPYRLNWNNRKETVLQFIENDPLPVVRVRINGREINAIIDTGGDIFFLDQSLAPSLKIEAVAHQKEPYAGGKTANVGYARAETLKLGDVELAAVPVKLLPLEHFSNFYKSGITIHGIVSTGVLQQFLATMDYPENRLILRPRSEEGRGIIEKKYAGHEITEMPFYLALSHLLIVKGKIQGREVSLMVDSGLADEKAALLLPKQSLNYLEIPEPPMKSIPESQGGLGGGGFPVGRFTVESLSLGPLRQENIHGLYGVFPPQLYMEAEFIVDGIISHHFLKRYAWTIDFDSRRMIFAEKE